ncbi:MAG: YbfB/YjiJ family MFS transporter [Vulcanimicrobiaceae bacterium]
MRFLSAAVVLLAVAMGVGRFAYTPLLPLMEHGAGLSHAMAGLIASSNLAGYLVGAISASSTRFRTRRLQGVWWAIAIVIATTALIAFTPVSAWIVVRFVTGVASGFAFVLGSSIVLDRAAFERRPDWVAIFYGGVGAGIALTAVAVPLLGAWGGWRAGWLGLGAISLVLCAVTMPWLTDSTNAEIGARPQETSKLDPRLFGWLFAAYGAQGMGYVIPATFIVAMIASIPSIAKFAAASWVVVGVVAIPSTIIWNRLGIAFGRDVALVVALIVMAVGAMAPVVAPNGFGVILSAATLGGTFVGVTALANALGRALQPERSHIAIGRLTAGFGVGQILGPAVAGLLIADLGSYTPALVVASSVLCLAAAVIACGAILARTRTA